ncbi:ParB N-terminal domain-containing protein [Clostridium sp. WILCCON 0269]|uniref:ParB N-terminal domain-containing protein n=1 Tax=Candidatus Clostridium eludens TaxID=3381663 RepID=A0ABW8SE44_9CLOT
MPNPKNAEIYGEDDVKELAEKIKSSGYIKPLYVNQDHVIISGHRRYKACLSLGVKNIPVVVKKFEGKQEELEILLLENMYRDKTIEQKVNEAKEWKVIEKEKAKRRQGTRTDIVDNCPPSDMGKTRDIVAKRVGLGSGKALERAEPVVDKITELRKKGDTENAEFLSKALDKSISGAKKLVEENMVEQVPKVYKDMVIDGKISVNEAYNVAKTAVETKKRNEENEKKFEEERQKEKEELEERQQLEELQKSLPENAVVLDKFRKPERDTIFGITDLNNLTEEQYNKCYKHCKKYEDDVHKVSMLWTELQCLQAWSVIYESQEEIEMELKSIESAIQNLCKFQSYFKEVKKK